MRVEAKHQDGRYLPGKITQDHGNGTYDILYDNGQGTESKKAAAYIFPQWQRLKEGMDVEAQELDGLHLPAKIMRDYGDGMYDIQFGDDYEERIRAYEQVSLI